MGLFNQLPSSFPSPLIVEAEGKLTALLTGCFLLDHRIVSLKSYQQVVAFINKENPAVILVDIAVAIPDSDVVGDDLFCDNCFLRWLALFAQLSAKSKVLFFCQGAHEAVLASALEAGAFDVFTDPVSAEELFFILKRACRAWLLAGQAVSTPLPTFEGIIGKSQEMRQVFHVIDKVAHSDVTALVLGESGTGKELIARAIHQRSSRCQQPLVIINCSALPESLLESELFGYEKGAFTGAYKQRIGRLESAQGGTVFLDEIGEIPLSVQVKLLRFLQEREIERVGGQETITLNTRIIAATNKNLKEAVAAGVFREDLFFRLSIVPVTLPPLRNRQDDILLLANFFLKQYLSEAMQKITGFTQEAIHCLHHYNWPGNIRELENKIRRGVILSNSRLLTPDDLGFVPQGEYKGFVSLREARNLIEREMIMLSLEQFQGNISRAARKLQISRPTLHDLLKKHDVDAKQFKMDYK